MDLDQIFPVDITEPKTTEVDFEHSCTAHGGNNFGPLSTLILFKLRDQIWVGRFSGS